ncbi:MAG: hypothetical protein KIC94_03460 [Clostridiales bacterium]|nr:hypothetical protein [Clostridiales bacterium]
MAINQVISNTHYRNSLSKKAESQKVDVSEVEESFNKAMKNYSSFVENRLENGEPSYPIGSCDMTEKEWDTLITKIDTSIDQIKEELKERIKVLKEREEKQRIYKEIEAEKDLVKKERLEKENLEKELEKSLKKAELEEKVAEDIIRVNQENVVTKEQIKQLITE